MKCMICGKEIDEENTVVGTSRETGEHVYYCKECFEEKFGRPIEEVEKKKFIWVIVPVLVLAGIYYFVSNIYLGMVLYFALSMYLVEVVIEYYGNDLIKLIAAVALPFLFNSYSMAYHLFLMGMLLQMLGVDQKRIYDMSAFRRQFGFLFTIVGFALMVVGVLWGAYNVFAK